VPVDPLFSPYILQDAEPSPYTIGEHLVASSSKLIVIDKILGDILPKGERVLIFSVCVSSPTIFPCSFISLLSNGRGTCDAERLLPASHRRCQYARSAGRFHGTSKDSLCPVGWVNKSAEAKS